MKKKFIASFMVAVIYLAGPTAVFAETNISDQSALIAVTNDQSKDLSIRKAVIKSILSKYNSPLAGSAGEFVESASDYNLDPYLVVSISGIESGFGIYIIEGTYNAFGWGQGKIVFKDWNEGIKTVSQGLRKDYIDRGATDLNSIMRVYCPPCDSWASKVGFFRAEFQAEEERIKSLEKML